jgi:glycerol-3-phosphate acyltransferase PlsY
MPAAKAVDGPHERTPIGPSDILSEGKPIAGSATVLIAPSPPMSLIFCSMESLAIIASTLCSMAGVIACGAWASAFATAKPTVAASRITATEVELLCKSIFIIPFSIFC